MELFRLILGVIASMIMVSMMLNLTRETIKYGLGHTLSLFKLRFNDLEDIMVSLIIIFIFTAMIYFIINLVQFII